MSATMPRRTGYEPLKTMSVTCRANLPAELWRALSVAERPPEHSEDLRAVDVTDNGVRVLVLPKRHYDALVDRVRDLEQWAGELFEETMKVEAEH